MGLATRATDPSVLLPVLWTVAVAVLVANYSFWVSVLLSVAVVFGSYRLATKYLGASPFGSMCARGWVGACVPVDGCQGRAEGVGCSVVVG